jgi:hypothetical protein
VYRLERRVQEAVLHTGGGDRALSGEQRGGSREEDAGGAVEEM